MYKQKSLANTDCKRNSILRDIAVIELLFATGARISELCNLTLQQVDLVSYKIVIYGKGSKERMIQIGNNDVKKILLEYYSVFKDDIISTNWFFINLSSSKIFRAISTCNDCKIPEYSYDRYAYYPSYVPTFIRDTTLRG